MEGYCGGKENIYENNGLKKLNDIEQVVSETRRHFPIGIT